MADNPTFQIPKEVIEPIIQAHVSAAITQALGGREQLIQGAVERALNDKVGSDGQPDRYNSSGSPTFLQWLVRTAIRDAATNAVREQITGDLEYIKEIVAKEIKNQRSPLTKSLVNSIAKAAADSGKFQVKVTVDGVDVQRY